MEPKITRRSGKEKPAAVILSADEWFDRYLWPTHPTRDDRAAAEVEWQTIMGWESDPARRHNLARTVAREHRRACENFRGLPRDVVPPLSVWLRERRWRPAGATCPEFVAIWCECMRLQDSGGIRTDREAAAFFDRFGGDPVVGQRCRETAAFLRADGERRGTLDHVWGVGQLRPEVRRIVNQQAIEAAQQVGQF